MAHSALEQKIPVTEAGSKRSMSVREVALRRQAEKAITGDPKALDFLLTLAGPVDRSASDDAPEALELSDQDRGIIQNFLNRQRLRKESK